MVYLVTGGSGSGKSEYAESLILASQCSRRFYVATMAVYGEEGRQKVQRHRLMRREKGFITLERQHCVGEALLAEKHNTAVLLECVSNLAANEMFGREDDRPDTGVLADRIAADIGRLAAQAADTVIVTNEVGADGVQYGPETMEYIRLMGLLNRKLAEASDRVVEVVYGIPVARKE